MALALFWFWFVLWRLNHTKIKKRTGFSVSDGAVQFSWCWDMLPLEHMVMLDSCRFVLFLSFLFSANGLTVVGEWIGINVYSIIINL